MDSIAWVQLDGVVNMRDLGGIPTQDGGAVAPGRLLRSDNLQDLSAADIDRLAVIGVTDVIDLRTHLEFGNEGPGPLRAVESVVHHHHTLFREEEREVTADDALLLPWDSDDTDGDADNGDGDGDRTRELGVSDLSPDVSDADEAAAQGFWASHYLGYLADRPDSVVAALRAIAAADGATIIHCAAGKDRTGTLVALALSVAGVSQEHIVADYAATGQRLQQIVDRLKRSETYRSNLEKRTIADQVPHPEAMDRMLTTLEESWGGVVPWLEQNGWTTQDTAALRAKLLD